jgi:hypothetical protein
MAEAHTHSVITNDNNDDTASTLWAATLEAWCHAILYTRKVYPKDSFAPMKFLGIQCYANRHPGVVSYIRDAIAVAIPSLMQGISNEICLVIHIGQDHPVEKYCLSFSRSSNESTNNPFLTPNLSELERESRQLILSVLAMDGKRGLPSTNNPHLSFQIVIFVPEQNTSCEKLNQALVKGEWFCQKSGNCSSSSSTTNTQTPPRSEERRQIVEDMRLSSGTIHFTLCSFDKEKTVQF